MFKISEFACKCARPECDAEHMKVETLELLNELRKLYGKPLYITSARRCEYQNSKVGGKPGSYHLIGAAVDIAVTDAIMMGKLVDMAIRIGFTGIGIAKNFIHLDSRGGKLCIFGY